MIRKGVVFHHDIARLIGYQPKLLMLRCEAIPQPDSNFKWSKIVLWMGKMLSNHIFNRKVGQTKSFTGLSLATGVDVK